MARAIELVDACAEALDIIDAYQPPDAPATPWRPGPASAAWATEAPRGLIFHAYELDEAGLVAHAQIVPPTSQNQAAIEADLAAFAPQVLHLPRETSDPADRAAHPELRPVHQLRHAFPRPDAWRTCHECRLERGDGRVAPTALTAAEPVAVEVLVCGAPDRGDDGAPMAAAGLVGQHAGANVRVRVVGSARHR